MALRINDEIPNLTVETDLGTYKLHDWIGDSWAILFSHPKDFTPVCTTEFGAVAQLSDEWDKRGTKVMGISVDGVEDHKKWKADIEKVGGTAPTFPIVADDGLELSKALDMLPAEAIRLLIANDPELARSWMVQQEVSINNKASRPGLASLVITTSTAGSNYLE